MNNIPDSGGLWVDKNGDLWAVNKKMVAAKLTDENGTYHEFEYHDYIELNAVFWAVYDDTYELTDRLAASRLSEFAPFARVTGFRTDGR